MNHNSASSRAKLNVRGRQHFTLNVDDVDVVIKLLVLKVTDGMPDQEPSEIVYKITKASRGRPLHCLSVTDGSAEVPTVARTFLEDISLNTRGSFHVVEISRLGDVKKVNTS